MPKQIPQEVKNKAMELFLEGKPAREIAENVTIPVGTNGLSSGPITVTQGFTVDVQGEWVII